MSATSRTNISKAFRPSNNHWRLAPGLFRERVTKAQLRDVLLNQPDPIIRGTLATWKSRHIAVGIYELWAELPKEER